MDHRRASPARLDYSEFYMLWILTSSNFTSFYAIFQHPSPKTGRHLSMTCPPLRRRRNRRHRYQIRRQNLLRDLGCYR